MELITVYLKRETENGVKVVNVYSDKAGKSIKATFNENYTTLPNKRRKTITINCWNYKAEWIN